MKRLLVLLGLTVAAVMTPAGLASAGRAGGQCGLPDATPLWLDFAGSTVGFRAQVFAHAGVIAAIDVANQVPPLVAGSAQVVYWQMTLPSLVGTATAPADPAGVPNAANALFDRAAAVMGCQTPLIALNELLSPTAPTPWTPQNGQYRANVLILLQTLTARGALR